MKRGLVLATFALVAACSDPGTERRLPLFLDVGPARRPADAAAGADGGRAPVPDAAVCAPCLVDADCGGGMCAQVGGDSYCLRPCGGPDACGAGETCAPVVTVTGEQRSACVSSGCGAEAVPADAGPAPDAGSEAACGSLVGPDVPAGCHCSAGHACAANHCFNGWWCNTATNHCQAPPTDCGSAMPPPPRPPLEAHVGPDGGTASRLFFAVVGDTRPPSVNDTAGYPSAVIGRIFAGLAALDPSPPFVVATGDYVFASKSGPEAAPQLDAYLAARAAYPGVLFPALGNHECDGYTRGNCGPDGQMTANYASFLTKMLGPIGKAEPWYEVDVNAPDGAWTSKFLFVAANAWSDAQGAWLEAALARPTTYTFVVRHEPADADTAPGVPPSERILARHPYTLLIAGHRHTYQHDRGSREVVVGNGGAPLTGSRNYGFALIDQQPDGTLAVDMIDYSTGLADRAFHFAVHPDGTPAP